MPLGSVGECIALGGPALAEETVTVRASTVRAGAGFIAVRSPRSSTPTSAG